MIIRIFQSEVTDINKQKFLAELGKLLTFMYEEDRQLALAMYSDIFDQADDQQALMNALVSPTRQAVVIARAYNAKERKLQIHSQFKDEDEAFDGEDGETPAFIQAICANLPFEFKAEEEDQVSADQFSLFDDDSEAAECEEAAEAEEESVEEAPREEAPEEEAADEAELADEPEDDSPEYDNISAETAEPVSDAEEIQDTPSGEETCEEEIAAGMDEEIDSELDEMEKEISMEETAEPAEEADEAPLPSAPAPVGTVVKPRIALLILYVILAVPITALGIVILLIPTLLFLLLAAGVIYSGSLLLVSAFGNFSMFSDIMVVLGSATVVLALGLLFFWIFIWFIGGAMAALVRLSLDLGRKWCYKEVPAV